MVVTQALAGFDQLAIAAARVSGGVNHTLADFLQDARTQVAVSVGGVTPLPHFDNLVTITNWVKTTVAQELAPFSQSVAGEAWAQLVVAQQLSAFQSDAQITVPFVLVETCRSWFVPAQIRRWVPTPQQRILVVSK